MGYLYKRGNKLWLGYHDASGKLQQVNSGLLVGDEKKARAVLEKLEARVRAGLDRGEAEGPVTVRRYLASWFEERKRDKVASAVDDEARIRLHALAEIGDLKMEEVRPRHIRDLVKKLRVDGELAPRSVRHVYGTLHVMFRNAVVDELIEMNPCVLKRQDLPKLIDKDPTWRAGAIFTRAELEQIISDDRIPPDRRVLWAVLGLAGLRFGEAAALRWRAYDATLEPLGRLLVASSWHTRRAQEKSTKTEQPRQVPVHPVLARILAEWKLGGWQVMMKRAVGPEDLIIPSRMGVHRSRHHSLTKFLEDLDHLGLRRRRQHDLRRTFISLARADGARKDILETVTHGERGDIIDAYTTLPWAAVCDEVAKLKVKFVEGKMIKLPVRAAVGAVASDDGTADGPRTHAANRPTAAEAFQNIALARDPSRS